MPNPPIIWNGDAAKLLKNKLKFLDGTILDASVPGTLTITGVDLDLGSNSLAANSLDISSGKFIINANGSVTHNPAGFTDGAFYKMTATMPASNGQGIRLDLTTSGVNTNQTALLFELKEGATGTGNMFGINANLFTSSTSNNFGGNGNMAGFFQAYHGTNTTTGLRAGVVGFAGNANASVGLAGIASDFPYAAGRYVGVHGRARNTSGSAIAGHFLLGSDLGSYTPPALTSALVCDSGGAGDMQTWLHNGTTQVRMEATGNFYFPGAGDIGAGDTSNDPGHVYTRNFFSGPTGSNTTPTYTFNGDLDTGIYRVAADTLGFTTSGVERLRISSSGDVQISGNLIPTVDDAQDIGSPSLRWREGYFSDAVNVGATLRIEDGIIYGDNVASGNLDLYSTSHATKGAIRIPDNSDFYFGNGAAAAQTSLGFSATSKRFVLAESGGRPIFQLVAAGSTNPLLYMTHFNGTVASPTSTTSGQQIGIVAYRGYAAGTSTSIEGTQGAAILGIAEENWGTGVAGARLEFNTTPSGTATATKHMTLDNAGHLFPGINASQDFGNTSFRWNIAYLSNYLDIDDGAGNFGFYGGGQFEMDSSTGNFFFYDGNSAGGFTTVVAADSTEIHQTIRYPDFNTPTANTRQMAMGFNDAGANSDVTWFFGHSVADNGIVFANGQSGRLGTDTVLLGITSPTNAPSEGQVNVYWGDTGGGGDGAGNIGSPDGGTTMARPDKVWIKTFVNVGVGSASAPSYTFDGDTNTGLYHPGADQIAISAGGTGYYFFATDKFTSNLDVSIATAGKGLKIAEGSNAKMGRTTLGGTGSDVVSNTSVTAGSNIFITTQILGGTPVLAPFVSTRTPGVSFTITSTAGDTSTVAWLIIEPS